LPSSLASSPSWCQLSWRTNTSVRVCHSKVNRYHSCICSKEISYLHEATVIRFNCVSPIPHCPIAPMPSPKMQAPITTCVSIMTPIVGQGELLSSSSRHSYNHNIRSRQTLHHGVRPRHRSSWLVLVSVTIWSAPFLLH
jgi:hypothetical protein